MGGLGFRVPGLRIEVSWSPGQVEEQREQIAAQVPISQLASRPAWELPHHCPSEACPSGVLLAHWSGKVLCCLPHIHVLHDSCQLVVC